MTDGEMTDVDVDQAHPNTGTADVMATLEAMAEWRLFKSPTWLADPEVCIRISQLFFTLGLEVMHADGKTFSSSRLGSALEVDLISVFTGTFDALDVPRILEQYGLIDESETDEIYERFDPDDEIEAERVLRPIVQEAWRRRRGTRHALS